MIHQTKSVRNDGLRARRPQQRRALFLASSGVVTGGFALALGATAGTAAAQTTSIQFNGSAYTQDFNTLLNTAGTSISMTTAGPFDVPNSSPAGWQFSKFTGSSAGAKFIVDDGSKIDGAVYSFGTAGSTERAIGSVASGSVSPEFGAVFVNNTATTYTAFTMSFTGEQWRRGTAAANTDSFSYAVGAASIADPAATFVNASGLNFTAPIIGGSSISLNGNDPANQAHVSATIGGLSWAPGQTLVIRWQDPDDGGNDDGLAIDDLSFNGAQVKTLTWTPGANRNWNTSDVNWKDQGNASSNFTPADLVNFTDTGVGSVAIDAAGVAPSQTTVSNNSGTYSFTGGPIAGGGKLSKTGNGALDLGSANNTFTGGTEISGGTLLVAANSALGAASSPMQMTGGTLKLTGNLNAATRNLNLPTSGSSSNIDTNGNSGTFNQILGSGGLNKLGSGTLTTTFTYNVTGVTNIAAGGLVIHQTGGTATFTPGTSGGNMVGDLTVDGPFRVNLQDGVYSGGGLIKVTTSGSALSNGGTNQFPFITNNIVLNSNSAAQPFVTTIGGTGGNSTTIQSVVSGASDVNIASAATTGGGSGTVVFNVPATYTGNTTINNGSVGFVVMGADNGLPSTTSVTFGTGSYAAATGTLAGTNGPGILDLAGHTLTIAGLGTGTGTNATLANARVLSSSGLGTLVVGGAGPNTTYAGQLNNGTGNIVSGTGTTALTISLGDGSLAVTKVGSNTLAITGSATYTGQTTVEGGVLSLGNAAKGPVLSGPGGANIKNGRIVFDYTGGSSVGSQVEGLLTTAYGSNFATGQLRSSTATVKRGLGWVEDAANSKVTVAAALYGDADLNGSVDLTDFTFLASNFNKQSGSVWKDGDFNYDDKVDLTDFTLLAGNFNSSLPADAAAAALGNVVPEPMSCTLLGLAGGALLARRRRVTR